MKSAKSWDVEGVHAGKAMSALPITYLFWFVGSPVMRRTRWNRCQTALAEIRSRLVKNIDRVEVDLLTGLNPKSDNERVALKLRREACKRQKSELII